ncbi:glycine cleavage system aminomethyltransferase GcvT [Kineosporia sp. J2-2]|uniref:Aminomethyltransferase n=1 Tax=Kineosporia corallincola TaxID=2835133 RepID=A0ABS5TN24_9ACTN|nr:glycine cleavage system aminomethyltransferase GcvT [Kineosporia corallincola]MBT0770994.1 glycine cleavage system aminomethyltransferase GcvT [Kineosporia corallincola]
MSGAPVVEAGNEPVLRRTPLYERHRALGAKLADFGGWEMPIEYAAGGVLKEHEAVRERVGVFDVSHLGKIEIRGAGAVDFVNQCLTNDLNRIGPGQAQYTLCCDPDTGGVVDDLIAYVRAEDDVLLVPNAANCAEVAARLAAHAPAGLEVSDRHDGYGVIAVQGTRSDETLAALGLPAGHEYMSFVDVIWQGLPLIVCRTGYTGERGYELLPAWEVTPALWDRLVEAVREWDGLPCGLGARDTLRTEMGYALHGHELSPQITPVQARLGWAVGWKKPRFWGREALLAEKEAGPRRVARGLVALGRGVPRAGMDVVGPDGAVVGLTTSGTFSPTLKQGVALGLLDPSVPEGAEVGVSVRGRELPCRVVRPPFVTTTTGS